MLTKAIISLLAAFMLVLALQSCHSDKLPIPLTPTLDLFEPPQVRSHAASRVNMLYELLDLSDRQMIQVQDIIAEQLVLQRHYLVERPAPRSRAARMSDGQSYRVAFWKSILSVLEAPQAQVVHGIIRDIEKNVVPQAFIEYRVSKLHSALNLAAAQQAKLQAIFHENSTAVSRLHHEAGEKAPRLEEIQELNAKAELRILEILTPEQQEIYDEIKAIYHSPRNIHGAFGEQLAQHAVPPAVHYLLD